MAKSGFKCVGLFGSVANVDFTISWVTSLSCVVDVVSDSETGVSGLALIRTGASLVDIGSVDLLVDRVGSLVDSVSDVGSLVVDAGFSGSRRWSGGMVLPRVPLDTLAILDVDSRVVGSTECGEIVEGWLVDERWVDSSVVGLLRDGALYKMIIDRITQKDFYSIKRINTIVNLLNRFLPKTKNRIAGATSWSHSDSALCRNKSNQERMTLLQEQFQRTAKEERTSWPTEEIYRGQRSGLIGDLSLPPSKYPRVFHLFKHNPSIFTHIIILDRWLFGKREQTKTTSEWTLSHGGILMNFFNRLSLSTNADFFSIIQFA